MAFSIKKIISVLASLSLGFTMLSGFANAESLEHCNGYESSSISNSIQVESMYLIDESQIVFEDGTIEITRLYSSVNPRIRSASGSGTFKNEKELVFSNEGSTPFKYWVSGKFTWNSTNDTATVTSASKGHSAIPSNCKLLNESFNYGSNQGMTFLFGKKYAYVSYSFTFKNWAGFERNASVYVDVNVEGVPIYK